MNTNLRIHQLSITVTNLVFSIVETLLVLRFIFKLFAANNQAPFVSWLYTTTNTLNSPFRNIFQSQTIQGSFVFDVTTLVSIVIYALLFSMIIYLFDLTLGFETTMHDSHASTYSSHQ